MSSAAHTIPMWTAEHVRKKSTLQRPLFIFKRNVYDLTDFVDSHPGGDVLLEFHGQDITKVMMDEHWHVHSASAVDLMQEYCVGRLLPTSASSSSDDENVSDIDETVIFGAAEEEYLTDKDSEGAWSNRSNTEMPAATSTFIDLNQPIFWQLWTMKDLSKDIYLNQVHRPRHLKEAARFFANPVLEMCSRTPWYVVPIIWIPISLYWLHLCAEMVGTSSAARIFACGILVWTLIEYTLHRFLFHMDDRIPDHKLAFMLHFLFHGVHHFLPMDRLRLVFPPALAVILVSLIWQLFHFVLPQATAIGIMAGGVFGYVGYDLMHYYVHHGRPWSAYMRQMKTYHMDHHYKNYHEGYGITSKLWDQVFRTEIQ